MIFQDPFASLNPRKRVGQIVGDPLVRLLLAQILGDAFARELIDLLLHALHVLLDEFTQLLDAFLVHSHLLELFH